MSDFVQCVEPTIKMYRYDDSRQGYFDPDGDYGGGSRAVIGCQEYVVVRRTPKGVWIAAPPVWRWAYQRFVLNRARKKYAYPTKHEAWQSFKIRKQRQLEILRSQQDHVSEVLRLIEAQEKEARSVATAPSP